MLSLFCSHLQFVIVSDQDIEKKIMKILCPAGIIILLSLKGWRGFLGMLFLIFCLNILPCLISLISSKLYHL